MRDGFGNARVQVGEGRFVVGPLRRLLTGEAARPTLALVRHDLDLAHQRQHVRREPAVDEHQRVDLACRGIRLGLREHLVQTLEHLGERGNELVVHRNSHGLTSWESLWGERTSPGRAGR